MGHPIIIALFTIITVACSGIGGESPESLPAEYEEACEALNDARAKRITECTDDPNAGSTDSTHDGDLYDCANVILLTPSGPTYDTCERKLRSQSCTVLTSPYVIRSTPPFEHCSETFIYRQLEEWTEKENPDCIAFTDAMNARQAECEQRFGIELELSVFAPNCHLVLKKGSTYDTCMAAVPSIQCLHLFKDEYWDEEGRLPTACDDLRWGSFTY